MQCNNGTMRKGLGRLDRSKAGRVAHFTLRRRIVIRLGRVVWSVYSTSTFPGLDQVSGRKLGCQLDRETDMLKSFEEIEPCFER